MRSLFLLLAACVGKDDSASTLDCESIAITTADGEPDPCDVEACQTCESECTSDCLILESYPPQYACADVDTWDVYDFCPAWTPPDA